MNTERMVQITDTTNIPDLGVEVSLQVVDGKIEAIDIKGGGNSIRILKVNAYSEDLKILTPQTKQTRIVYRVEGSLLGLTDYVGESYKSSLEAEAELSKLIAQHGLDLGLEVKEFVEEYYPTNLI